MIVDVLWEPHLQDDEAVRSPFENKLFCGRRAFRKYVGREPTVFDTRIPVPIDLSQWIKKQRSCGCKIPQHETWCKDWKRYEDSEDR
jgi:hypothetical protein